MAIIEQESTPSAYYHHVIMRDQRYKVNVTCADGRRKLRLHDHLINHLVRLGPLERGRVIYIDIIATWVSVMVSNRTSDPMHITLRFFQHL